MWASFVGLSVVPWLLFAQSSRVMDAVPVITPGQPEVHVSGAVHDHGRLFGSDAKRRSHAALRRIQRDYRVPVVIETFESLEGRAVDEVARRRPRPLSDDGIYILLAGRDRDVAVRLFRDQPDGRSPKLERAAIREAFLVPLRAGDADGALEGGIRAVETMLADLAASEPRSDRGAVISVATLSGILSILLAIRYRGRDRGGSKRRRSTDVGAVASGHVGRVDADGSPAVHAPRVGPARARITTH